MKSVELKQEVERGSTFTRTSDLYARTHVKITRHWKSTLMPITPRPYS